MSFTESDLRALSICAGAMLALSAACMGVDSVIHGLSGALIGFGIGVGTKKPIERRLRKLKVM